MNAAAEMERRLMAILKNGDLPEYELQELLNKHSKENDSDFVLATYLGECLRAVKRREHWHNDLPSEPVQPR